MTPDTAAAGRECPDCNGRGFDYEGDREVGWNRLDCPTCQGTGRIPTDDNPAGDGIGEYYARKERERKVALEHLNAALCGECHGRGEIIYGLPDPERIRCEACNGTGNAPGVTDAEIRRLREAYELAAYVGD